MFGSFHSGNFVQAWTSLVTITRWGLIPNSFAEDFSFALAVILTPPVIVLELRRLFKGQAAAGMELHLGPLLMPGLIGMVPEGYEAGLWGALALTDVEAEAGAG